MTIQFKAVGNAPILKNNKIKLAGHHKFISLIGFLKEQLKSAIKDNDSLVIINLFKRPSY
jgi:hypothetical protein